MVNWLRERLRGEDLWEWGYFGCRGEDGELKWQGVIGSVLGEQQPRTLGDDNFISKKTNQLARGCISFLFQEGERPLP
jgi:hypothetical protein